ncbi:unnamed protein product [Calypogeia fissa]
MTAMAAGARVLSLAGGTFKELSCDSLRLNPCPGGLRSVCAALPSTTLGNDFSRRFRVYSATRMKRLRLETVSALNTGASPDEESGSSFRLGATRLKRIIQSGSENFLSRFKRTRKNFPTKIFLLLLGYYSANALATVLGQTGDWDVLAAGILVALIEGIGYLMYRMPPYLGDRGKELVVLLNYYKSGFSFGLFVDAFKLGS